MEMSHRIAQVLGVPTAYLCCEDDDLAEVILAGSKLARGGRAQAKKLCWGWWLGGRGERLGSRYDAMSAGLGGKRLLAAYRYRQRGGLLRRRQTARSGHPRLLSGWLLQASDSNVRLKKPRLRQLAQSSLCYDVCFHQRASRNMNPEACPIVGQFVHHTSAAFSLSLQMIPEQLIVEPCDEVELLARLSAGLCHLTSLPSLGRAANTCAEGLASELACTAQRKSHQGCEFNPFRTCSSAAI